MEKAFVFFFVFSSIFFSGCAGLNVGNSLFSSEWQANEVGSVCLNGSVETIFSPGVGEDYVSLVDGARESIEVQLFQFSYSPLVDALVEAKARGVRVRVILEPRLGSPNSNLKTMELLRAGGVDARWARLDFDKTHSKFAVVDGKKVVVGSNNWSYHAMELNREAAVIIVDERVAREFLEIFEEDWRVAGSD